MNKVEPTVRDPVQPLRERGAAGQRPRWRTAAAAALGLITMMLTGQLIGVVYRDWHGVESVPVLGNKLAHLEAAADAYDLIFAGSSRVYREFDPQAFDIAMDEAGCPVRSYNLGVAGLNVLELRYLIERLARLSPARLRWLLIEEMPPVRPSSFGNERSRFFMRLETLPLAWRDIATAGPGGRRRLKILALVLYAHAYEALATGMLASLLPGLETDIEARRYWAYTISGKRAGFVPLEDETAEQFTARERDLDETSENFQRTLERARNQSAASPASQPLDRLSFIAETAAIAERRMGVTTVLVLMPNPYQAGYIRDLAAAAQSSDWPVRLENLNDYQALPWLADPGLWFDRGHLGSDGAARLSRHLAGRLCSAAAAD